MPSPRGPYPFSAHAGSVNSSPLRHGLSGYNEFRTDAPLSAQRRKEAAESNANMGVFMTTKEFIGTFFSFPPPRSCPTKPPLMSNDIANEIRKAAKANNERRIAELWVRV